MRRRALGMAILLGALGALAVPAAAFAKHAGEVEGVEPTVAVNTMWVMVAALLVLFMQAGFAMLEIGFSRSKNAGSGVAKILTNLSIAAICYWAVGFALAFGADDNSGGFFGTVGFFVDNFSGLPSPDAENIPAGGAQAAFPVMGLSDATIESKWIFQFAFCAVSLAIVWGSTLERIKFSAYVVYAVIFASVIYPVASHWVFGGGWLQNGEYILPTGMQDFAGSTAVHLIGATGALAALLLLGPRKHKFGADGRPRAIPGHSMPLVGLGTVILFVGWFGFNPGSTLGAADLRFPEVALVTLLGATGGVIGAFVATQLFQRTIDIGMVANGMIAGLVAITAPSGYIEPWPAPIIGAVAGVIVVAGVIAIEKKLDDPVGALSAHGLAGIWGTLSCGIFTSPELAQYNAFGDPAGGLWYSGSLTQLIAQALGAAIAFAFVFVLSFAAFALIKATIGLRVADEQEDAGLDIAEHGMYGYPEQFIPLPEIGAASEGPVAPRTVNGEAARQRGGEPAGAEQSAASEQPGGTRPAGATS